MVMRAREILAPAALFFAMFGLWETLVRVYAVPAYLLPAPTQILKVMLEKYALLLPHAWITLQEIVLGFLLAFTAGVALAFALFYSPLLERAFYPWLIASQNIPIFAITPLLVIWFGFGLLPKVLVAALIVFFPILINTLDGLKAADPDAIDLLKIMRAGRWHILRKARLPAALPFLLSGTKIGITFSVMGAVIGEWIGGQQGLGYLMNQQKTLLHADLVFAAIFWLSGLAIGLVLFVSWLERCLMPWRKFER
jgi:ABC-type nitrate/sulfonate/bicarbonate transport system permease component